jgi:hypothetical protein
MCSGCSAVVLHRQLINRYGATTVMACGVVLMLALASLRRSGTAEWNFRIAHRQRRRLELPVRRRDRW